MAQSKFGAKPGRGGNNSANPMVIVMGFFFLLFSVLGGAIFYLSLSNRAVPLKAGNSQPMVEMVDVVVPMREVRAGAELEPALFTVESRPADNVSSKIIKSFDGIRGKYAASDIIAGQPLHADFVTDTRPSASIQTSIPVGSRAVTIRVDATSSVEGWARPGARVDVTWIGEKNGESIAKTIVEAAQILSFQGQTKVETQSGESLAAPSTVTLLVTQTDSVAIQLAQSSGRLSLTLRNDKDPTKTGKDTAINIGDVIRSSDDGSKCTNARKRGITKITKANGEQYSMVLDDLGVLVPLEKFCDPTQEASKN
jgi:pilus assembly protein CpaB